MSSYTFPFDTCEIPNKNGVAQPYSVIINIITCSIVLYFLTLTTTYYSFFLLLSLLIFELFHTLSHFIHIKGKFLYTITHISGFLVNLSFLNFLYNYTGIFPSNTYLIFLGCILIADLFCFLNLSFIFFIATQIFLFLAILYYYYNLLPSNIKERIQLLVFSTFLIYLLFVNEKMNCKKMMKIFPNFPFHMIIEIVSIIPIYYLSYTFYNL
jgi:hypothetical protein